MPKYSKVGIELLKSWISAIEMNETASIIGQLQEENKKLHQEIEHLQEHLRVTKE